MELSNFNWGQIDETAKKFIIQETFVDKIYEKFFSVEENDIVLDIGASVGIFTYSILDKKPKHVYSFEPSEMEFPMLVKNTVGYPVTPILKGISNTNSIVENDLIYGENKLMEGITFKRFCELYQIDKIDFLKTDCEGGEYDIFNEENFNFIKNNVKKIVGEWHLGTPELKEKFRKFREQYIEKYPNIEIYSVDGVDIKWSVISEHFLDYYTEVIIYINNK
jgi:hypothetical protein